MPPARDAYLIVMIVVVPIVIGLDSHSFLLFIAGPQIWFFSDRVRDGVIGTVVLTAGVAAAFVVALGSTGDTCSRSACRWA